MVGLNDDGAEMIRVVLEFVVWGVAWAALLGVLWGLGSQRQALAGVRRATWIGIGLILLTQLTILLWVVPAGPWHSFHHDIERWGELQDLGFLHDAKAASMHGPTSFVLMRAVSGLVPTWWWANGLLSMLASLVGFFLAKELLEDEDDALIVMAVHALLPVRLRIATSLQLYVGAELALLTALLLASLHLRLRSERSFGVALAALLLAMLAHLELMAVAPVAILALVVARDPRWLVEQLPRRGMLGWVGVFLLVLAPRLVSLALAPSDLLPGAPQHSVYQHALRLRALSVVGLGVAVSWAVPGLPSRYRELGLAALGVGLLLFGAATGMFSEAAAPLFLRVPDTGAASLSALLSPSFTPAAWTGLAAFGFFVLVMRGSLAPRAVLPPLLLTTFLHAASDDGVSTYVRIASISAWPFALFVGAGIGAVRRLFPAPLAPVLLLVPLLATAPHLRWLGRRQVEQDEAELLRLAREHLAAGGTVVVPTVDDLPEAALRCGYRGGRERSYLRVGLGDGHVLGLRQALDADALPPDALLLWPEACQAHVTFWSPAGRTLLLLAGRVWEFKAAMTEPARDLAPCWSQPDLAAKEADGACEIWSCPAELEPGDMSLVPTDPLCQEVMRRFPWTPVAEMEAGGPVLSGWRLPEGAHIGLYRLKSP